MDTPHIVILRKNLVFLKEHLEAGDALDHLYQEGVFTQSEYNKCKKAGPDKCGTLLELLMKKGEEAYKSFCAFLDESQPHIKEHLDATSAAEGATKLLYVHKLKMEREHKQAICEKEKINLDLQEEIIRLKEKLVSQEEEFVEIKTAKEEEKQEYARNMQEERKKHEAKLAEARSKIERLEKQNEGNTEEIRHLKEERDKLTTSLAFEKEKYEAVTELTLQDVPDDEEQEENTETEVTVHEDGTSACVFNIQSTCDESQLMLLPCLHAACIPCIDHHIDQLDQGRLLCPCGAVVDVKVEELPADHVRRNEAVYNVSKHSKRKCSYIDHEDDNEVSAYCRDCDVYFCPDCRAHHDRPSINKRHKVTAIRHMKTIPIQKWLKEMLCLDHPDHKLELFDNNCGKAICLLCSHGTHRHPDNVDLQLIYQQRKSTLEDTLTNQQSKLKHIRQVISYLRKHQIQQNKTVNGLKYEVVSIHQKIAGKFLHRQKQLLQDISHSLEGPQQAVQEKLKDVHAAEKSIMTAMDYIKRALQSTRKAELISLTAAIHKLVTDHKMKLPSDDTRDTRVSLSFQGQKALEEIIEEFGSLVSCIKDEEIVDCQPTLRALLLEKSSLSTNLALSVEELQKTKTDLAEAMGSAEKLMYNSLKEQAVDTGSAAVQHSTSDVGLEEENVRVGRIAKKFHLDHRQITLLDKVEHGYFGPVKKGIFRLGNMEIKVAVKAQENEAITTQKNDDYQPEKKAKQTSSVMKTIMLFCRKKIPVPEKTNKNDDKQPAQQPEIINAAEFMQNMDHKHIVRMLGIYQQQDNIMLVLELALLGPLHTFLSMKRDMRQSEVVFLMWQVAEAMTYLEDEKLVHRNLAARNVLLFTRNLAKISAFGMTKAMDRDCDYYEAEEAGKWPLKWYAPECIYYFQFYSKSDVWSYGITLWEALSYGKKPYHKMKGQEILEFLQDGLRMQKPDTCCDEAYGIMLECWNFEKSFRPSFRQLTDKMKSLYERLLRHKM